jgi:hypothetical protein
LFRDRARVVLKVQEMEIVQPGGLLAPRPVVSFAIYNRGRRTVYIASLQRLDSPRTGGRILSSDLMRQLTAQVKLDEGQSHSFTHGELGGHKQGDLPIPRWFVVDGAGRVHPLRERYRQRAERVIFFPTRWWWRRQHRKSWRSEKLRRPSRSFGYV